MNKKNIIITVLVIVLVVIIVLAVGLSKNVAKAPEVGGTNTSTSTTQQTTSTDTSTATSSMTVTISTSGPKTYSNSSFSFTYPGAWTISSANPLLLTDFNGKYQNGGIIPAGGAEITMVTTTISGSENMDAIMAMELADSVQLATSTATVNGVACTKAIYQVNYAPGFTVQNFSEYCARGSELWKMYLSYPANDSQASTDTSEFGAMLGSMKLSG